VRSSLEPRGQVTGTLVRPPLGASLVPAAFLPAPAPGTAQDKTQERMRRMQQQVEQMSRMMDRLKERIRTQ
jgi:hypothetical protein